MSIKETLKQANRYDDIMSILRIITESKDADFPVDPFNDDNSDKIRWRVDGTTLRDEAIELTASIENDTIQTKSLDDFNSLYQYAKSAADTYLHNYAVQVSHKTEPDEAKMEKARIWLILWNLLVCLDNDPEPWYIPDGWAN